MESQLQKDSKRAAQFDEEKSQLEDAIRKQQQDVREMRNTLEKYTASIQVNWRIMGQCLAYPYRAGGSSSASTSRGPC